MSRTTPASTKAQKSQCFFLLVKTSPAKGWRRLQKNTDFFVLLCLLASFLTFGKVNPSPLQSAFVLAPASFLTFGKVNDNPPQTDIFLGGGGGPSPPPSPHFCQHRAPPQTDIFLGGGGEGFKSQPLHIPFSSLFSGIPIRSFTCVTRWTKNWGLLQT